MPRSRILKSKKPAKYEWMDRLADVRTSLECIQSARIGRPQIQIAFGVERRQAVNLLHEFGAKEIDGRLQVSRVSVLSRLDELDTSDEAEAERERKRQVVRRLREARRAGNGAVEIMPETEATYGTRLEDLQKLGVVLEKGKLTVTFQTPRELAQKCFSVAVAMLNDYQAFTRFGLKPDDAAVSGGVAG